MDIPKNWEDCTVIARRLSMPPQIVAKVYDIKPSAIEVKRGAVVDEGLQSMLDFIGACERGEVDMALGILREYFEKFTGSKTGTKYVFQQAMYLGNDDLASAALRKMVMQTPDD